jgi:hypothetical protein
MFYIIHTKYIAILSDSVNHKVETFNREQGTLNREQGKGKREEGIKMYLAQQKSAEEANIKMT